MGSFSPSTPRVPYKCGQDRAFSLCCLQRDLEEAQSQLQTPLMQGAEKWDLAWHLQPLFPLIHF